MRPRPPRSTLFPYTTLFRSGPHPRAPPAGRDRTSSGQCRSIRGGRPTSTGLPGSTTATTTTSPRLGRTVSRAPRMISPTGSDPRRDGRQAGFTLLELLVVTLILMVLVGVSVPQFRRTFRHLQLQVFASDRKSTRLNSSHLGISYAVFCLKN